MTAYPEIPFENIKCPYCDYPNRVEAVDLPKFRHIPQCETCSDCGEEFNIVMRFEARKLGDF